MISRNFFCMALAASSLILQPSCDDDGDGGGGSGGSGGSNATGGDGGGGTGGPEAMDVDIRFEDTCPFEACGGEIEGTWVYTDACVENAEVQELLDLCTGDVTVDSVSGLVKGSIEISDTMIKRDVETSIEVTAITSNTCDLPSCGALQIALNQLVEGASCDEEGDGCRCDITFETTIDDEDTYTVANNTITTGSGSEFEFCVEGGALQYDELASDKSIPGIYRLE